MELFRASPIATWTCDRASLAIAWANDAALAQLGWSRAALAATPLDARWIDADRARATLADGATATWLVRGDDGDAREADVAITAARDGERDLWLIQATRVGRPGGRPDRAILERLGALLEHADEGIAIANADAQVEYVSPAVERILGVAPGALIGPGRQPHPDDLAAIRAVWHQVRGEPGATRVVTVRYADRDGEQRWIELAMTNLLHDPSARGMVTHFRDVTERRRAEESVARSEANFRALIETAPVAVLVHRDGRIIYANPTMATLLGYPREALLGMDAFSIVAPAMRDAARSRTRQLETADGTRRTPVADDEMIRADGRRVAVEVEGLKLDFDGAPAAVVLARDVTERRAMIGRMAAADRLASVGTLAAGVAHEINNPLAYLQNNLTMLAEAMPTWLAGKPSRYGADEVKRLLRDALDGAARIRSLVRDLRALSHPDLESVTVVDVREVLETCLRMADNEIKHRARLVARLGRVPAVEGNPSRLSQVFLNLLINAAQAIPDGATGQEIRVASYTAASGGVIVEIEDTGAGIPDAILGHIFDPFFTTKPVGVGTGLGLAICHGIVKGMGGAITVASAVGKGSTFRVELPPARRPMMGATLEPPPRDAGARKRILVIDDEPAIAHSLGMLLGADHDVTCETRASDALARLQAGAEFDVVLCDLMMPEMSGMQFHARVVESAPALAPRIVFLTGGAFTPASRDFLERVPNPRLEKPFDLDALYGLIRELR